MSSNNCIAILHTKDKFKEETDSCWVNQFDNPIDAYRVAHIQGFDTFGWLEENELHNLGVWMKYYFDESPVFYDLLEARNYAFKLYDKVVYTEYGIVTINATPYNFPGA